jgi:MFS family permease
MQIWNLIFAVGAALLVDRLGRRFLFLTSSAVMLISYVIITGLSGSFAQTGNASVGTAVVPFLFIYFAGYDIALTPLVVAYPCEIWPYSLRSRGLTVTWVTAILAIFFNTFINPIALDALAWKYYLVFIAVLLIMTASTYFFYPETRYVFPSTEFCSSLTILQRPQSRTDGSHLRWRRSRTGQLSR